MLLIAGLLGMAAVGSVVMIGTGGEEEDTAGGLSEAEALADEPAAPLGMIEPAEVAEPPAAPTGAAGTPAAGVTEAPGTAPGGLTGSSGEQLTGRRGRRYAVWQRCGLADLGRRRQRCDRRSGRR